MCARRRFDGTSRDKKWDSHLALALRNEKDEGKERENRKGEKEMRDINCTGVSIKGKSQQDTTHRDGRTGNDSKEYTNCQLYDICGCVRPSCYRKSIYKYLRGLTKTTTSSDITL